MSAEPVDGLTGLPVERSKHLVNAVAQVVIEVAEETGHEPVVVAAALAVAARYERDVPEPPPMLTGTFEFAEAYARRMEEPES